MSYKDKAKQREANRKAKARQRAKDNEPQGMTLANNVIPKTDIRVIPKRGTDIKCFADLPPDVQRIIETISRDDDDKARRTARAIRYQHLFPDRYESTGLN